MSTIQISRGKLKTVALLQTVRSLLEISESDLSLKIKHKSIEASLSIQTITERINALLESHSHHQNEITKISDGQLRKIGSMRISLHERQETISPQLLALNLLFCYFLESVHASKSDAEFSLFKDPDIYLPIHELEGELQEVSHLVHLDMAERIIQVLF